MQPLIIIGLIIAGVIILGVVVIVTSLARAFRWEAEDRAAMSGEPQAPNPKAQNS